MQVPPRVAKTQAAETMAVNKPSPDLRVVLLHSLSSRLDSPPSNSSALVARASGVRHGRVVSGFRMSAAPHVRSAQHTLIGVDSVEMTCFLFRRARPRGAEPSLQVPTFSGTLSTTPLLQPLSMSLYTCSTPMRSTESFAQNYA
jgi:hypothetical protein